MPLTLLCFLPDTEPLPSGAELADLLRGAGASLQGSDEDAYRPWTWQHPATGASCLGDLGPLPLAEDELHPARAYDGYQPLPLQVQIPLTGPHWFCVEVGRWLEGWRAKLPQLCLLDTENIGRADGSEGPSPLDRPRLLAGWEELHASQTAALAGLPRMQRLSSLALWRYRCERVAGSLEYDQLQWPAGLVLACGQQAHSAVIWSEAQAHWALPPVELIVLAHPERPGLLPSQRLLAAIGAADALGYGACVRVRPELPVQRLFASGGELDLRSFTTVAEHDWSD